MQAGRNCAPRVLSILPDGIKKKVLAGILQTHCELQPAIVYAALVIIGILQRPTSSFPETIKPGFTQSFSPCSFAASEGAAVTEAMLWIELWWTRRCEGSFNTM